MRRDRRRSHPSGLIARINNASVSVMFGTPATWQMLIARGWLGDPTLKIVCGGETLSRDLADKLLKCGDEVWNIYGPTETTICSTVEQVHPGTETVSIGSPIDRTTLQIMNSNMQLVPQGVPGELYIGGAGLAQGYYRQPELTAKSFIADPLDAGQMLYRTGDLVRQREDGSLAYVGRTDHQIKLRGYRIESGEIEAVLRDHPNITDAVLVMKGKAVADRYLEAYVVLQADVDSQAIVTHLRSRLPAYMVPRRVIPMGKFPITPNGKVDRMALANRSSEGELGSIDLPSSDLEIKIALIWRATLDREMDRNANFFEHGGNSLLAVELLSRLEDQLGITVPFGPFYNNPTIAALALCISDEHRDLTTDGAVPLNSPDQKVPTLFCIDGVHLYQALARALDEGVPVCGIYLSDAQELLADIARGKPTQAIARPETLAKRYLNVIRTEQPNGPYRIAGFSYGGIVAYEIAQQLIAHGEQVEALVLLDAPLGRSIAKSRGMLAHIQHSLRITWLKRFATYDNEEAPDRMRKLEADHYEQRVKP
jgi:acyl carrier protein